MISVQRFVMVALVGLILAGAGLALTPDEDQLVGAIESFTSGGPTGPRAPGEKAPPHRCGSALLREAFARWDTLSDEAKQRLAPMMTPPASTPEGVPCAPGGSWESTSTAHFAINYMRSGTDAVPAKDANANRVPDYVEQVAAYLEKAYQKEVSEMGFLPPPFGRTVVYLKKLKYNGLTHPLPKENCWIEFNADIETYTKEALGGYYDPKKVSQDPEGPQAGLLKAVCAHEFFHGCQARYSWGLPDWWSEGTCDWMGNQVFPESGFYLNNVGPHLESPFVSLFAQGDFFEYSASLFPTFLSENLPDGAASIRKIWEGCKGSNAKTDNKLDTTLNQVCGNLQDTYMLFACYMALRNFKDGDKMPAPRREKVSQYPATFSPQKGYEPQHYGATFVELLPSRSGTLSVSVGSNLRIQLGLKLILINKDDLSWKIVKAKESGGKLVGEVPSFGDLYDKVIAVVANFSPNSRGEFQLQADVK